MLKRVLALVVGCLLPVQSERVQLAGEVSLARLLDLGSKVMGRDVVYNKSDLQGTVTIRLADELNGEELWALASHLLQANGLTTIRTSESGPISVVKTAKAHEAGISIRGGDTESLPAGYEGVLLALSKSPSSKVQTSACGFVRADGGGS